MRVWVLGSGTLRPDPHRGSPGYWIEAGGHLLLLDCGAGSLRTLARLGLPWSQVTHLLVSHLHTDHVGDLAPLLFALKHGLDRPRREPLRVLGPEGLRDHLRLLAGAHGSYVTDPGFPLEVLELQGGDSHGDTAGGPLLKARQTRHSAGSLAFRIQWIEGDMGYTGDTGPDPALGDFLRGCRLLVAECSHPDGEGPDTHLTPVGLAELAGRARPDLLVTVHAYPPLDPEKVPDLLAALGYTGEVRAGRDGMSVQWKGGAVEVEEGWKTGGASIDPLPE